MSVWELCSEKLEHFYYVLFVYIILNMFWLFKLFSLDSLIGSLLILFWNGNQRSLLHIFRSVCICISLSLSLCVINKSILLCVFFSSSHSNKLNVACFHRWSSFSHNSKINQLTNHFIGKTVSFIQVCQIVYKLWIPSSFLSLIKFFRMCQKSFWKENSSVFLLLFYLYHKLENFRFYLWPKFEYLYPKSYLIYQKKRATFQTVNEINSITYKLMCVCV